MVRDDEAVKALFQRFVFCFPYSRKGRFFQLSLLKAISCLLLLALSINGTVYFFIIIHPWSSKVFFIMFFSSYFGHVLSIFFCLLSMVRTRRVMNLPFLHLSLAVAHLRNAGMSPHIKTPTKISLVTFLHPLLVTLPSSLIMFFYSSHWYLWILFDYTNLIVFYQFIFRIMSSFIIIRDIERFDNISLALLGEGIHYLGKMEKIFSLVQAHNHIQSAYFYFDEIFSTAILATVSTSFINITVCLYYVVLLVDPKYVESLSMKLIIVLGSKIIQTISLFLFMLSLVHIYSSCRNEVSFFNNCLPLIVVICCILY